MYAEFTIAAKLIAMLMTEDKDPEDENPEIIEGREPEITSEPEILTEKENETMEIHHHAHHEKKNWKSYFWEFLMLFLAVFCGFLAEYQLEHVIEHNREKAFMASLAEDLETDHNQLETYIGWRTATEQAFDSLLMVLAKENPNEKAYRVYELTNNLTLRFGLPDVSERTILQLKNAGGLRLIRNNEVSNAINKHYMNVNRMKSVYETERLVRLKLMDSKVNLLDAKVYLKTGFPPEEIKLRTDDYNSINHFMNDILVAKQVNKQLIGGLNLVKESSGHLKRLIEKEYPK